MSYINGKKKPQTSSLGSMALLSVILVFPAVFIWSDSQSVIFLTRAYCLLLMTTSIILSLYAIRNNSGRGLGIVALIMTLGLVALVVSSYR
jgi:hypothetical protein